MPCYCHPSDPNCDHPDDFEVTCPECGHATSIADDGERCDCCGCRLFISDNDAGADHVVEERDLADQARAEAWYDTL